MARHTPPLISMFLSLLLISCAEKVEIPDYRDQDLRIGFDLMGPGEVWVDDVQILDTWFSRTELGQLEKDLALARFQLEQGRVLDCQGFLDSYWPRFFKTYVPLVPALQPVRRNPPMDVMERPAATTAERPVPPWYRRWLPRF